jgi:hypothetical protein
MNVFAIIRDIFFNLNGCDPLVTEEKPKAPKELTCIVDGEFIKFTWLDPYNIGDEIISFDVEYKTNCNSTFKRWTVTEEIRNNPGPDEGWYKAGDGTGGDTDIEIYKFKPEQRLDLCGDSTTVSFRIRFINENLAGPWCDVIEVICSR